ncbi:MAG: hypothetical protein AAF291_00565 [Pseudomonadota bacterium]
MIPHSQLSGKLNTTKAFRAAHSPLREDWIEGCSDVEPRFAFEADAPGAELPEELVELADFDERALDQLTSGLPVDQVLIYDSQYPATREALTAKLDAIDETFVRAYKSQRTNPAKPYGATELSPYLHFGMVAPWEVAQRVRDCGAPKSYGYKLLDELLTWREWSHWRMTEDPSLLLYESLPRAARATLDAHRDDLRDPALSFEEVLHGQTPDSVFNAAARCWLETGWLHNNLRMYWAKQVLRFMPSPEQAWAACCYVNDRLSYDGRDPATYISMRWAFGEAKPGYRDIPIYGRIMPKSPAAIFKREGMKAWIEDWSARDTARLDCADFAERSALYGI